MEYGIIFFLDDITSPTYEGMANLRFNVNKAGLKEKKLNLDYNGKQILKLKINGTEIKSIQKFWIDSKIELTTDFLKEGANEVEIYFVNEYAQTTLEGGLFSAKDSQEEYIYTNTNSFSAHKLFPCFDQLSLRATFKVLLVIPTKWKVVSNDSEANVDDIESAFTSDVKFKLKEKLEKLTTDWTLRAFDIADKISPSMFGFVAGDLEIISMKEKQHGSTKLSIYTRKSVARQARQESDDLFLLMGAAIDYFEGFFGKNYPSRKCDLIFLPHLLDQSLNLSNCCILDEELLLSYESDVMTSISRAVAIIQQQSLSWVKYYFAINWWNDTWLEQGLSLFLGYLGLVRIYRSINSKLKRLKGYTEKNIWSHFTFTKELNSLKRSSELPNPVYRNFEDSTQYESTDILTYLWKAASAWRQLSFLTGDENFKRGVKKCVQELVGKTVTTKQFAMVFEQSFNVKNETPMGVSRDSFIVSNNFEVNTLDFTQWMDDWIYAGGVSNLDVVWDKENLMFSNLLRVKQSTTSENPAAMRNLRIKIAFFNNTGQIFKIKDTVITNRDTLDNT